MGQVTVPLNPMVGSGRTTNMERLNHWIESDLDWKPTSKPDVAHDHPVILSYSEDAHLLKCEKPVKEESTFTIFGIYENQSLYDEAKSSVVEATEYEMVDDENLNVIVQAYTPILLEKEENSEESLHTHVKNVPHFDWGSDVREEKTGSAVSGKAQKGTNARVKLIDLSKMQKSRRQNYKPSDPNFMAMDSPAATCHFLRSVLRCGDGDKALTLESLKYGCHCASPWRNSCTPCHGRNVENIEKELLQRPECDHMDQVIAILLCGQLDESEANDYEKSRPMGDKYFWDELEENELREFQKFRTGDACPNYYLYSTSSLKESFSFDGLSKIIGSIGFTSESDRNVFHESKSQEPGTSKFTLFVYRHLPSRPQFSPLIDNSIAPSFEGPLLDRCLWEKVRSSGEPHYRMVSPPYQDIMDVAGNLMKLLTNEENMKILVEEAMTIPQWTAWPERTHYQSEYDDDTENIDSAYPASWTVFPLCHTFPASDVSKRKFIPATCGFVPKTTKILQSLGPMLRTALFSRLEPRTKLNAHTGWSDLANHILRVHIPLCVPSGDDNEGLCGTWVDGCIESHSNGRIICFDDSKTHRAFNYTEEERVVLIVDLARPLDKFPLGTATGGHTDELEAFINQFT